MALTRVLGIAVVRPVPGVIDTCRLAAGDVGPKLAAVIWNALPGFAPETTKDIESLEPPTGSASPAHAKAGSASPTRALLAEPHQQPALTRPGRTDKIPAPPLTPGLRRH